MGSFIWIFMYIMMFKKFVLWAFLSLTVISLFSVGFAKWLRIPATSNPHNPEVTDPCINENCEIHDKTPIQDGASSFTKLLNWIVKAPTPWEYQTSLWYVLSLIKYAINRLLWVLSFVALVYMLYCWFLIFSSWSDDKNAQKGKKWITTAAIALAWLWLSWLIISAMIWIIKVVSKAG